MTVTLLKLAKKVIALHYAYFFAAGRFETSRERFLVGLALRMISARRGLTLRMISARLADLADLSLFLGKLTPLFSFRWTSLFAELPKR